MLVATDAKGDYAFLNLKGPAFDLSDRGVKGRPAASGLDAFVYTERGVYRSGETVHVMSLLRDAQGAAALNVPLTLVVERPDGIEYRRIAVPDQGVGGHSLDVPINAAAQTGTWRVRAFTDPKRPAVGETTFLVEDYVADRLEFDLAAPDGKISRSAPAKLTVDGRYLYGAPASALDLEGEIVIGAAKERPGLAGYQFGLADEEVETSRKPLEDLPQTDDKGKASFEVALDKVPAASRPLEAKVIVRLAEAGGRAVERNITLPILADANMIGVKPLFSGRSLGEGENANFDVALVAPDGKMIEAKGLRYELLKIDSRYQYYRRDGRWEYEPIKSTRRIADGKIDVAPDKPGRISAPVQWGRYRLEVSSADVDGPVTSIGFDAGWYTEASADTPDMLEIALDKPEYKPGDQMTVAVTARAAGRVTLNVMGEKLLSSVTQEVTARHRAHPGAGRFRLGHRRLCGGDLAPTARRPGPAHAGPLDRRAVVLDRPQGEDAGARHEAAAAAAAEHDLARADQDRGLGALDQARVVVAAVDVGILNLTNYKPPAPDEYYLGQRQLSAEVRDLYGQLIDGMQGTRGQIRTGGDAGAELNGSPPSQAPLALYSGIVEVRSGQAEVAFEIPAFAGTVRVMAVAWSKDKVGRASGDVIVRDPVVLTATLPRFLLTGDKSTMNLDLDNVEGAAGAYNLTVSAEGTIAVGEGAAKSLQLRAKQRDRVTVPLNASGAGPATVKVAIKGPGDFALERSYVMNVKPATQVLARRTVKPIAKGESLTLSSDLFADLVPGTGTVAVSVGVSTALDAASCSRRSTAIPMAARSRSPAGRCRCSTSTSLRALPILRSTTPSTSASATPSTACWPGSRRTARSASGASAATTPGSMPT